MVAPIVVPIAVRMAMIAAKKGVPFLIKKFGKKAVQKYGSQIPSIARAKKIRDAKAAAVKVSKKPKPKKGFPTTGKVRGGRKQKPLDYFVKKGEKKTLSDAVKQIKPDRETEFGAAGYNFPNFKKGGLAGRLAKRGYGKARK